LYIFGINAVVLTTFVMVALSYDDKHRPGRYPRKDLLRIVPLRAVLTDKRLLLGLRVLSVALLLLVVLSGLLGNQAPEENFAPTFVWVVWWVGLSLFTVFVGNVWPLLNPWKVSFEWADGLSRRLLGRGLQLRLPYPSFLGLWPALVLFAAFVWIENVFEGSTVPSNIALFAVLYSALTWAGMVLFGKGVWLERGEAFSVFFGILGRFAPTEVRVKDRAPCNGCGEDCRGANAGCVDCYECFAQAPPEGRELFLRPFAAGLVGSAGSVTSDRLVFVVVMLASVTYDSLLETPFWANLSGVVPLPQTAEFVALPLVFLGLYLTFVKLGQLYGGKNVPFERLAAGGIYSFVPIAIAYQVAHYYTLLLFEGQAILALLSDPFGWGWNLFGTAGWEARAGVVDAAFVWYSQVVLIVAGHLVAVYLAHAVAIRLLKDPARAARSQYPMAALMILYTVFSLWILTQPAIERGEPVARTEGARVSPAVTQGSGL